MMRRASRPSLAGSPRLLALNIYAPFAGDFGRQLIEAYEAGRHQETLAVGRQAILSKMEHLQGGRPLVFDVDG